MNYLWREKNNYQIPKYDLNSTKIKENNKNVDHSVLHQIYISLKWNR